MTSEEPFVVRDLKVRRKGEAGCAPMTVRVFVPVPDPEPTFDAGDPPFMTRAEVESDHYRCSTRIYGLDGFQSLLLAIRHLEWELIRIAEENKLEIYFDQPGDVVDANYLSSDSGYRRTPLKP